MLKHIPLSIYLSIYLPIRLNHRGGHQTGPGEPSTGCSFSGIFFLCVCVFSINYLRIEITILRLYGVMKNIS